VYEGSSDVVRVGKREHLYSDAESRLGAQSNENRAVRGLKMILSPGAKTNRKMVHDAEKIIYLTG
jgi:hypothetical protein